MHEYGVYYVCFVGNHNSVLFEKNCFTRVYQLDFFCTVIKFHLPLSPYLSFICLLYLDLYVLGDDALISQGSFMQTKYLFVLIHI